MKIWPLLLAVTCSALCAAPVCAEASGNALAATVHCASVAGPGRVLCELSVHAVAGRLVWSDALVVRAPAFARPLRSRVVATLGTDPSTGASAATAKLALVASQPGQGQLDVLARGVVCRDPEPGAGQACHAVALAVSALVLVGAPPVPAPAPPP